MVSRLWLGIGRNRLRGEELGKKRRSKKTYPHRAFRRTSTSGLIYFENSTSSWKIMIRGSFAVRAKLTGQLAEREMNAATISVKDAMDCGKRKRRLLSLGVMTAPGEYHGRELNGKSTQSRGMPSDRDRHWRQTWLRAIIG
jgi:hypothetical protein